MSGNHGGAGAPTLGLAHVVDASGPVAVQEAIAGLGRTEDVRFSPDGRRVAITCFHAGAIAVVDVEVSGDGSAPAVAHTGLTRLVAAGLEEPHGVDWLDDQTLIVADRAGWIGLLAVPDARPGDAVDVAVDLLPFDGEFADVYGPGSVRVLHRGEGEAEVLICNNWGNCVTRTRLVRGERWGIADSRIGLRHLLDLPDGVAASGDGAWVAVSNHNQQVVVIYEGAEGTGGAVDRAPVGVLRGTSYPHGLRFDRAGEVLGVADAGSPFVHVHRRGERGWEIADFPTAAVQVLTWDEFASGNARPDEGGPKGLDLDPSERLLAITCEAVPLRWIHWRAATASAARPQRHDLVPLEVAALERESELKAALARVELRLMETETREHEAQALASRMTDRAREIEQQADALSEWATREIAAAQEAAEAAHHELAATHATKTWRALARARGLYGRLRPGRP